MEENAAFAPHLGERLAIEFANTAYAVRGRPREGIDTPRHLLAWLRGHAKQLTAPIPDAITDADAARFRDLRDAIRAAGAATTDSAPMPAETLRAINEAAAAAPCWPELGWLEPGGDLAATVRTAAPAADALRAEIARDATAVFSGPDRDRLRRCGGPGCILFFVKDHPRRQWCSPSCGTRARVARHYHRHKQD